MTQQQSEMSETQTCLQSQLVEENRDLRRELERLREELETAKTTITLQQECLFKGYRVEQFEKCPHCHKIFTNNSYLAAHLRRRHDEEGQEPGRRTDTGTQTEEISRELNDSELHDGSRQSLLMLPEKQRKTKGNFRRSFSSLGKKVNKMLQKK